MSTHHHRLVLVDRNDDGLYHRHRWKASCGCGCGWAGIPHRRKQEATGEYRAMVEGSQRARRTWEQTHGGRHGSRPMAVRPLTPAEDLPEALR